MDISTYQIQHGLHVYASQLKSERLDATKRLVASTPLQDRVTLSDEGKQKQLLEQAVSPVSGQLAMRPQQEEERAPSAEEVPRHTADEEAQPETAAKPPQHAGRR